MNFLTVADRKEVDKVGERLRVVGAVPTGADQRVLGAPGFGPDDLWAGSSNAGDYGEAV